MTKRQSKEVQDLITELEQGFPALRNRAKARYEQVYCTDAYQAELVANLSDINIVGIPYPSRKVDHAARLTQGILRRPLQFHVEAASKLVGDEKTADKVELFFAHAYDIRLNEGGRVRRDTHRHQSVSPFAAWWMEWVEFKLPEQADEDDKAYEARKEAYRKSYWPFKLSVPDPLSVAFFKDESGHETIGGRAFELSWMDICKRYGADDTDKLGDKTPLSIYNRQFAGMRGGTGMAIDTNFSLHTNKAKVWVVDDGSNISHYIDGMKERKQEYYQVGNEGEDFPNPWGGLNSLTIVTGAYNADARDLEHMYEPILEPLMRFAKTADTLRTHASSIALSPPFWGQVLPEGIREMAADGDGIPPTTIEEGRITNFYGAVQQMHHELSAAVQFLADFAERDVVDAMPSPFLTNPDASLVKEAAASSILAAIETGNKYYDDETESELAAIRKQCQMMVNFLTEGYLNKKGQGEEADESLYFTVTGREPTKKFRGPDKGRDIKISPRDFENFTDTFTLEIQIVASTESQKRAEYDLTRLGVLDGVQTREDLIATLTEDVSGQVFKLELERRARKLEPVIDNLDLLAAIEVLRMEGRDYSMLAMQAGILPGAPAPGGLDPDPVQIGGGMMQPPATNVPAVGVV